MIMPVRRGIWNIDKNEGYMELSTRRVQEYEAGRIPRSYHAPPGNPKISYPRLTYNRRIDFMFIFAMETPPLSLSLDADNSTDGMPRIRVI